MTRVIGVIPARLGSSRFPGKPLAALRGRPLIEHVYRRTSACTRLDDVIIATCDEAIAEVARGFGARVVMTASSHERASDRVAEAVADDPAQVVVMIQGDEPMLHPAMVDAAIAPLLQDGSVACTNLVSEIRSEQELFDPNVIKVVMDRNGRALYFSRQPIPTPGRPPFRPGVWLKQVCVIPFRRDALARFQTLPPGRLERAESVDMLRFLEHGVAVHLVTTSVQTHAVDTPADLVMVETLMAAESTGV